MTTKRSVSNILAGVLGGLIVLVIGAILISTNVIDTGDSNTVVRQVEPTQPTGDTTGSEGRTVRDIYAQEGRGVAYITANGVTSDSNSPFELPQQGTATGSGFAINKDGYIVTNAHVVEGADSVEVSFDETNGDSIPAEVKGVDTSADIAVLKVNPDDVKGGIKPTPLGDSSNLQVGDPVIAIGNPFGYTRTVTTGIVSGLQRQIQAPNGLPIAITGSPTWAFPESPSGMVVRLSIFDGSTFRTATSVERSTPLTSAGIASPFSLKLTVTLSAPSTTCAFVTM